MKNVILILTIISNINLIAQNPNPSPAMDEAILEIMDIEELPGTSTLIVKGGEIVWIESYGMANTETEQAYTNTTSQMIASVSKIFTGTALMQLYEDGSFDLDDAINDHLPLEIKIPGYENQAITFRMLLTHTSSIKDGDALDNYYNWNGDPTISLADCIERYFSPTGQDYDPTDNFLNAPPGTVYEYTNIGTALEGYLVEVIANKPFSDYCNQHIFEPLCMENTHWFLSEYENLNQLANPHDQFDPVPHYGFADYPDGMLHSNVTDMANFMIAVLQGGQFHNFSLLSSENINAMMTPQIPSLDGTQGFQYYTESFDFASGTVSFWGHNGGEYGIAAEMFFDRDNDMGMLVLANGEEGTADILELLYDYGLTLSAAGTGNPDCTFVNSIETVEKSLPLSVYPNPATDHIIFESKIAPGTVQNIVISDLTGRVVLEVEKRKEVAVVDVSGLAGGLYFYRAGRFGQQGDTRKFFLNRNQK